MSETVIQPPWLAIAEAVGQLNVQQIAYISAAAVASLVAHAGGGVIATDPANTTYTPEQTEMRMALALKIIGRKVDTHTLTVGLAQIPEVAAALAANTDDQASQLGTVDLVAAWTRNWTDYASLIAALG